MEEEKSTKARSARGKVAKKAAEPKFCVEKLSNGEPCPKIVENGKTLCQWHDPEHESWRDLYAYLETTPPEQKTKIVLRLIEAHPERKLMLPIHDGRTADLQGADLSNIDLQGAYLLKVDLQDADLRSTNLRGAFLDHANLQGATLEGAKLQEANLMHATLQGANLKNANMSGADLKYANLHKAHLEHANLKHATFLEAQMQNSDLQGADLQEADLIYAKLLNARFNRAKLMGAKLEHAQLEGAYFGGANLTGAFLYAANLRGAHLEFANLQRVQFNGANLQECDLTGADLHTANLKEAKLQNVDLSVADSISNVYITGAWLDRTRIRLEKLKGSIGEEMDHDFTAAKYGYLALKQNFDDLGDYEASSWAYRRERQMEKREAWENKHYFKFFSDTLVEWLCDYGESASRVIGWIAVLLFVVGPLFFSRLGGIVWSDELSQKYFAVSGLSRFLFWYRIYLLYTLDTLTTASFSGLQPINDWVRLFSGLFAIIGVFLAGLLGFVAGNRIRRS
jgi:uncharacterized protein YjbI with pentapeptide repeats